jgi:predicted transcriptional regulator
MTDQTNKTDAIELATELTIAWLANPNTRTTAAEVPAFLDKMYSSVQSLVGGSPGPSAEDAEQTDYTPAVTVRKSLADPDYIISLIDGKKYKTLRRHLATNGMTPDEYRRRYGLKAEYPMVAANYSEARRAMAHKIGLGNSRKSDGAAPKAPAKPKKPKTETAD